MGRLANSELLVEPVLSGQILEFFPLMHCHFHRFLAVVSFKRLWSSLTESHRPVRVVESGHLERKHSNKPTNSP